MAGVEENQTQNYDPKRTYPIHIPYPRHVLCPRVTVSKIYS